MLRAAPPPRACLVAQPQQVASRRALLQGVAPALLLFVPRQAAAATPQLALQGTGAPTVGASEFIKLLSSSSVAEVYFTDARSVIFRTKTPLSDYSPLPDGPDPLQRLRALLQLRTSPAEPPAEPQQPPPASSVFRTSLPSPASDALLRALSDVPYSARAGDPASDASDADLALRASLLLFLGVAFLGGGDSTGVGALLKRPAKRFGGLGNAQAPAGGFSQVAGCDEAKAELVEVVDVLRAPERYRRLGARPPRGVLLVGAPGCGKTLLARSVAAEAGVPFFSASASEFVELFVGLGSRRVRSLFKEARAAAPCVVFIDELDAVGRRRSGGGPGGSGVAGVANEEREQTLNQLLTELDGFEGGADKPVIVLAATNRPEVLDEALKRPGRFDRTVTVTAPDAAGRAAILAVHLGALPAAAVEPGIDLRRLAAQTFGFSGAQLAGAVNEAALLCARRGGGAISLADLERASERVIGGMERRSLGVGEAERRRVALHEAGHALLGACVRAATHSAPAKVSIVPRASGALGWTLVSPSEGDAQRWLQSEPSLRAQLAVLLGGRAAERHCTGVTTTGAADDLSRASQLASDMVTRYGMSGALGPRTLGPEAAAFSPELAGRADAATGALLGEAEAAAAAAVAANEAALHALAERLLVEETVGGDELTAALAGAVLPAHAQRWVDYGEMGDEVC